MRKLPLNDPRRQEFAFRNAPTRRAADQKPRTPMVAAELAQLLENPADLERFRELWPELCSEGTAWAAAYAAVPYVVDLARRVPPEQRVEFLGRRSLEGASQAGRGARAPGLHLRAMSKVRRYRVPIRAATVARRPIASPNVIRNWKFKYPRGAPTMSVP
jgi:hypothetical protein